MKKEEYIYRKDGDGNYRKVKKSDYEKAEMVSYVIKFAFWIVGFAFLGIILLIRLLINVFKGDTKGLNYDESLSHEEKMSILDEKIDMAAKKKLTLWALLGVFAAIYIALVIILCVNGTNFQLG